ncbi:ferric reductase-like transmembrane domain-containing protein [Deinococcus yunweiensis]|uniref:ferric reductase-like transmembrane domain-containing protein n=1 Tax=Deinococcus yunweiensis TaxID=367282 RepID=UPI00398F2AC5
MTNDALPLSPTPSRGRALAVRHGVVAGAAVVLTVGFVLSRPEWSMEHRVWRALGDAGLLLLFTSLAIGPAGVLWPRLARLRAWRREVGIWFGLLALLHTAVILQGWLRWDMARLLGYEYVPQLGRVARLEPGLGLANLLGLAAAALTLMLLVTSSDRAIRRLGPSAWKFVQLASYPVFYLSALHTAYFVFMHFSASFHRPVPTDANWFRLPFLALTALLIALQVAAFVKTTRRSVQTAHAATPK